MTGALHRLFDLSGRVAIVTGGSRGIGLQMAEALGEFGAHVVITARKADELAQARQHLEELGIAATTLASDLSDVVSIPQIVTDALAVTGRIDILVNNAGATWGAPAEAYPAQGWAKVMDLNLNCLFDLTREVAARAMLPQRYGRIINIASIAGLAGNLPGIGGHRRLQCLEGRRHQPDARARFRVGRPWHHSQRPRAGLFPFEDDGRHPRQAR